MSLEPDMSAGCDCGHPQPASPLGHLLSCAVWRWHTGLPAPELQPTTCTHPDGHEGECPCPPGCACCQVSATTAKPTPHAYLSTGCHHGRHDYCKAMTGWQGEKRPAVCKWCASQCVCPCHGGSR